MAIDNKPGLVASTDEEKKAARRSEERSLLWKIDLLLMPILTISYGLQYYDKAVLGSASIFGIIKDLGLSTSTTSASGVVVTSTIRYSTANAAFYWGYIVAVLPFALILTKLPVAKVLSVCVLLWGITCILTIVVKSYEGLVVQRVFLGLVESSVSPGFLAITSMWYRKEEQALRLGIWYSATGIFSMFSGVINYGLGSVENKLSPWKYMYIFAGSVTIVWSFVILALVPDSPFKLSSAISGRIFNEEDRTLLARRAQDKREGEPSDMEGSGQSRWQEIGEAAKDPMIWLFGLMGAAIYVCNGGVTAFGARIISSFGYTSLQTIVIAIPGGAFTMVSIYLVGWLAGRYKDIRTILLPLSCIPVMVGSIIIWKGSWVHKGLPLFGFYLLPCFGAPYVLLLALSAANIRGSTKRAVSGGAIFIGYNVGNIIGPYTVLTPEKPIKYRTTWICLLSFMSFTIVASLGLRWWMKRENARWDREEEEARAAGKVEGSETDKERELREGGRVAVVEKGWRFSL